MGGANCSWQSTESGWERVKEGRAGWVQSNEQIK